MKMVQGVNYCENALVWSQLVNDTHIEPDNIPIYIPKHYDANRIGSCIVGESKIKLSQFPPSLDPAVENIRSFDRTDFGPRRSIKNIMDPSEYYSDIFGRSLK